MQARNAQQLYHFEHPPLLIVISGTSGSGKDSVVKALVRRMQGSGSPLRFVVTATTRPQRENEVHGIDYLFVTRSRFEEMIARDELIEHALVYGQYKGVPKEQVRQAMASGQDVVMRLDVQGAAKVRQLAPEAVLIFLAAPSEQELLERLQLRRTESQEQLQIRLETARQEMEHIPEFDYVVPNLRGELDKTVETVVAIITAERHRTQPRQARL